MIFINQINKYYLNQGQTTHALIDVSIEFIGCGITFIIGKSGSGKSTLLRILAGIDKDYTGNVELTDSRYYVSSDYDLFSELTVLENLALTQSSMRRLKKLAGQFNLEALLNKKAKALSNGEKRRIQLIKAVLMGKKIILLDETVSALDRKNLYLVMHLLKRLSRNHLIIMVTHNDALLKDYADQIIELANGKIIKNQIIQIGDKDSSFYHNINPKKRKKRGKALYAYSKELFTNKLVIILLAILITVTSSTTISFFSSTNTAFQSKKAIETNNATLTAVPIIKADSSRNYYYVYPATYKEFNNFYYQDIVKLVEQYPQIIAINPYYSFKFSELFTPSHNDDDVTYIRDSIRYHENYPSFIGMTSTGEIEDTDFIISEAYYMDQQKCLMFSCSDNLLYAESTSQVINNKVNVFTLVNDYSNVIQLLYGTYGSHPDEIVIDYSLAEKLQKSYQLESIEELLNHEFILNIVRKSNAYSIDRYYTELTNLNVDLDTLDEKYIHAPYESVSFTITGVTEFNNASENNAYLTGPILDNPLLFNFLTDTDHSTLPFTAINIMVKPSEDMEAMKESLNTFFHLDQSQFYLVSETKRVEATDESYQVHTPTIISFILVTLISLAAFIFVIFKDRSKTIRTISLLDRMDYPRDYLYISQLIEYSTIVLFSVLLNLLLQHFLNRFSHDFNLAQLTQADPLLVFGIASLVSILPLIFIRNHDNS